MCGVSLTGEEHVAPFPRRGLPAEERAGLPERLKPVGKALAISAATVAVEAGVSWMRRKSGEAERSPTAFQRPANEAYRRLVTQSFEEASVWVWEGDLPAKRILVRRVVRALDTAGPTAR